jgi:hypothetical protein
MGIVVDEYALLEGIVTRTDLLEAIAGDIPDVGEEPEIVEQNDGTFVIDGMSPADEAFNRLDITRRPEGNSTPLPALRSLFLAEYLPSVINSAGRSGASKSLKWIVNGSVRCSFQGYPMILALRAEADRLLLGALSRYLLALAG